MVPPLGRRPARHGIALALTAFLGCAAAPAASPSRPPEEPPPSVAPPAASAAPAPTVAALPPLGPLVAPSIEQCFTWRFTVQDFSWCLAHPPTCEATVGEVEACVEELKDGSGGCFESPAVSHCKALRPCFWGYAAGLPGARQVGRMGP